MKNYLRAFCLFFLLFCFILPQSSLGQDSNTGPYNYSLKQCIDYALSHQSKVLNSQIDEKIAMEKVKEIRGIGLPQINGSLEVDDYLSTPKIIFPNPFGPGNKVLSFYKKYNLQGGLSASQLLFDGSYIVGLQAAKTYEELSSLSTNASRVDIAANVTKAYYGVIVNEKRMSLVDANVKRLEKIYSDTKAMNENGFVEKLDVDRLSVTLNNLTVERNKLRNFIDLSYNILKLQMGMPMSSSLHLTDTVSENQFPAPVSETPSYDNRVEYQLLNTVKKINSLDLKRNRFGYLPSAALFGGWTNQATRDTFGRIFKSDQQWLRTLVVGARITVPIFDGLQKHYRIEQSKLNLMKNDNDIANLKNVIDFDVAQANLSYTNNYNSLEVTRRNFELAKEVERVAQIKYEQGIGSNLEVLNAETSLKEAETNYFGALYDVAISQVDLLKAKGLLVK